MSRNCRKAGIKVDRSKAAAWAWHQRGMSHPARCSQQLGGAALMISRRVCRTRSSTCSTNDLQEACSSAQRPSRFKREAAAAALNLPQVSPSSSVQNDDAAATMDTCFSSAHRDHDHAHHDLHDCPQLREYQMIQSPDQHSPCTSPAYYRTFLSCAPQSSVHPAADHYHYCNPTSPAPRRRSESSPRPMLDHHQMDEQFGLTGRKSMSGADDCRVDRDMESLRSLSHRFCTQLNCGDAAAGISTDLLIRRSSLFDSFELQAVFKKLALYDDHQLALLTSQDKTPPGTPKSLCDHHNVTPPHCKQTLSDLLGWADHCSSSKNRSEEQKSSSTDHYYYCESPDMNSSTRGEVGRRRPSILMAHLPQSFSNALHHLPQRFSNALHHLPHCLSSALHQIAHLTHTLSPSHRHNVAASPHHGNEGAASPVRHQARTHQHLIPSHLSHLLSGFKTHHSPPNPSCCNEALDSAVPAVCADSCGAAPAPEAESVTIKNHLKTSPSFDQNLSTSNDYMLIYKMAKKHSDHGVHHIHHHHHYHQYYHYIF